MEKVEPAYASGRSLRGGRGRPGPRFALAEPHACGPRPPRCLGGEIPRDAAGDEISLAIVLGYVVYYLCRLVGGAAMSLLKPRVITPARRGANPERSLEAIENKGWSKTRTPLRWHLTENT